MSCDICSGVIVRVYSQVGKSNEGKFALDVAVKSLDLYKGYFLCLLNFLFVACDTMGPLYQVFGWHSYSVGSVFIFFCGKTFL